MINVYKDLDDEALRTLRALIYRKLGDAAESDDILQEACLRLHRARQEQEIVNPTGYLYRITANLIVDYLRSRRLDKELNAELRMQSGRREPDINTITPENSLDKKQDLERVVEALADMPDQGKRVFLMHRTQGKSYREIADELGIAPHTVEKHMVRALRRLRKALEDGR